MDNNILAVGSIAIDSIKTIKGNQNNLIGGSASYFSLSASKFAKVRVVGVVGDDFPKDGWEMFENNNIDVSNIQIKHGKTFTWGGEYSVDYSSRETLYTNLGVFEGFSPLINSVGLQSKYIFLGNIQPYLQLQVKNQIKKNSFIICDTMNLWIDNNYEELLNVISNIDVFMLNEEEAKQLTNMDTVSSAGNHLLRYGPKAIIVKMGEDGAILFDGNNEILIPSVPNITVCDPTGAGDSFAGGFVGYISKHGVGDLVGAVINGTAIASFAVEGFGLSELKKATQNKINSRIKLLRSV